jgi:hypothetical protein
VKLARTKRSEDETSHNHPSPTKGRWKASTCAEAQKVKCLPKPKNQSHLNAPVARTSATSGQVALQSKNLRPHAPSTRVVERVDLFHLYNILLASKHVRPAIRRSKLHTTKQTLPIDQAPILTTQEAARIFKVTAKTFLQRYAPLLHPIPSANHSSRRRHLRWSRAEIERLAFGRKVPELNPVSPDQDINYVLRELEKRLE